MTPLRRAELRVDLGAVARNWQAIGRVAPGTTVAAMVKADGYGLGAAAVARALLDAGASELFVADLEEGIELRTAIGSEPAVFVLAGCLPGTENELLEHDLTPVLIDLGQVERWNRAAAGEARAVLHVDTGMQRTGLDATDRKRLLAEPERLDGLHVSHVMSHLACADEPDAEMNARQLASFTEFRRAVPTGMASLANSAGVGLGPAFHFDHVRPGIALYGSDPTPDRVLGIEPVVELIAPVVQVRAADTGDTVGYGATHPIDGPRRLATIGVGYGDGYLRAASNRGHAAVAGHRVPIVGRVSMDLLTVDVTEVPDDVTIDPGTAVELIGPTVTLDEVADAAGTIPYEILTDLGRRHHRVLTS